MNRNYARIDDTSGAIVPSVTFAPSELRIDGTLVFGAKEAQYRAARWYPVHDTPPSGPYRPVGYRYVQPPAPVRTITLWNGKPGTVAGKAPLPYIECVYESVEPASPGVEAYDAAMEAHLYEERAARGYTTREPDAYLSSENPRWAQDARDWVVYRDAVMEYALAVLNAVAAGGEAPTLDEFKAALPRIAWTVQTA